MFARRLVLSKSLELSSSTLRYSRIDRCVTATFFSKAVAVLPKDRFEDSAETSVEKTIADNNVAELNEIDSSDLQEPILPENRFEIGQRTTKLSAVQDSRISSSGNNIFAAVTTAANTISLNDPIWTHFWQVVIETGVPALFTTGYIILAFGLYGISTGRFGDKSLLKKFNFEKDKDTDAIKILYDDLYGNQGEGSLQQNRSSFFAFLDKKQSNNIGIPKQQYIKVTYLNDRYDSFIYSVNAATTSKANAALQFRQSSLVRALRKVISSTDSDTTTTIDTSVWTQLQRLEQIYLVELSKLYTKLNEYQNQLTVLSIQDELISNAKMDKKDVYKLLTQIDPKISIPAEIISTTSPTNTIPIPADIVSTTSPTNAVPITAEIVSTTNPTNAVPITAEIISTTSPTNLVPITAEIISTTSPTSTNTSVTTTASDITTGLTSMNVKSAANGGRSTSSSQPSEIVSSVQRTQKEISELDMEFVKRIVRIAGPDKAAGINAALLGTPGGTTSTGLLSSTTINGERPLTRIFGSTSSTGSTGNDQKKNIYVMDFPGDISASHVSDLREVVTSIILAQNQKRKHSSSTSTVQDEAIVVLQSGGGTVTGYGLAAAQLLRLKEQGKLKLTICVEEVAASGGYMMACCADTIIASPFAVLGSIGVIYEMPNAYNRLKREGVEFQTITAGKYKRTITPTKEVTKEDLDKSKEELEEVFMLFRNFVKTNRPQLDIDSIATGETWYGTDALDRKLCDEIKTVDDVLVDHVTNGHNVYQIEYMAPEEILSGLRRFLPSSSGYENISNNINTTNILQKPIKWLVRTISDAVKDEVYSTMSKGIETPIEKRFMMKDDTANRIRIRSVDR